MAAPIISYRGDFSGTFSVPMTHYAPRVAMRWRLSGTRRITWRHLLVHFIGILPLLFFAASLKAGSIEGPSRAAAIVINEDPSNPLGQRHEGSVVWRVVRTKATEQPDEFVIHAHVEIPDMQMTMEMDVSRNTDKQLPASHIVEMTFVVPQDVAGGEVFSVPGVMLKFSEQARGVPLAALAVKVTKGSFMVGLSNVEADRQLNLQLLKERGWFDIPMIYADQHRGILAIEKGFHGEDVFREAMAEWERPR
jgi:hypothetical protein